MPRAEAPTPSRPTDDGKGARTRARILAEAVEHFAEHGLEGASVPEIARRVGVSHAAVYQHFGRKEDLFRAAVDAELTAVLDSLGEVVPAGPGVDAAAELVGLAPRLAAAAGEHPLGRRVLAELGDGTVRALDDLPAMERLRARVRDAIVAGQASGDLRTDLDPDRSADGLLTVLLVLLSAAARMGPAVGDLPRAPTALGFLSEALRAPPTATTPRPVAGRAPTRPAHRRPAGGS